MDCNTTVAIDCERIARARQAVKDTKIIIDALEQYFAVISPMSDSPTSSEIERAAGLIEIMEVRRQTLISAMGILSISVEDMRDFMPTMTDTETE